MEVNKNFFSSIALTYTHMKIGVHTFMYLLSHFCVFSQSGNELAIFKELQAEGGHKLSRIGTPVQIRIYKKRRRGKPLKWRSDDIAEVVGTLRPRLLSLKAALTYNTTNSKLTQY